MTNKDQSSSSEETGRPAQPDPKLTPEPTGFNALAAVLAYAFPGLGHLYLGQVRRGVYIMIGLLGLIGGGLFIGGIDSVDSREDGIWYIGQVLAGPVVMGIDAAHQSLKVNDQNQIRSAFPGEVRDPSGAPSPAPADAGDPVDTPPYIKSLGKANEFGTLLITVAGMMNIVVLLDALLPPDRYREERELRLKKGAGS